MDEQWAPLVFTVPAMSFDVYTKKNGKRVKKLDERGQVITTEKIIPKERPRFSVRTKRVQTASGFENKSFGHAHSAENTVGFESWVRKKFFEAYPGNCGVYYKNKPLPVHSLYLGCRWYGEETPCTRFRKGKDFMDCQVCRYRRKNLVLGLKVFLKDERHLDLDNVLKIVLDAMEKVCFYNDSQFVRKNVELIPYAKSERLEVTFSVLPTTCNIKEGSVIGGYSINKLSVKEASEYIGELTFNLGPSGWWVDYLARCDKRKYIKGLTHGKEDNTAGQ